MDKNLEQPPEVQSSLNEPGQPETADSSDTGTSRRRFTRNSIIGTAVIASLGNRAAWATDSDCISAATWNSIGPASMGPGATTENSLAKVEAYKARLQANGMADSIDADGNHCAVQEL